MKVTDLTRRALSLRRFAVAASADGFVRIEENGTPLWRLRRGSWLGRQIIETRLAPDGLDVWIKVSE